MTDLRNSVRMAASILKVGQSRVWIDPNHLEDVAGAVTRQDIRKLIKKGRIRALPSQGVSRGRARILWAQRRKGRRRGPGSRKGARGGRDPSKRRWIRTVRAQREVLRALRESGALSRSLYRKYYLKVKGGVFRSRNHLLSHLKMDGAIPPETPLPIVRKGPSKRAIPRKVPSKKSPEGAGEVS